MKNPLKPFQYEMTISSAAPGKGHQWNQLRIIFWLVAFIIGFLQAWADRHDMFPDGISYLDVGDAFFRDGWTSAVNAYWSPLYAWLLGLALFVFKPPPYWEFSVAHLVNFAIFLFSLGCFDFFLRELIRHHRRGMASLTLERWVTLPEWAYLTLGYSLFIWSSLFLISVSVVTPDMLVSAFVYLSSGIILRIRNGSDDWLTFAGLGATLGLGYLAKAVMFPLAFVFLVLSIFSVGNLRRATPRVLVALIFFLLVGGPFILALSKAKGRFTFGESGKLTYTWFVNGTAAVHWQGGPAISGVPLHPTRKILAKPPVYEFGAPVGGTYPPWFDPTYWFEGVRLHFDLTRQMRVIRQNLEEYYDMLFSRMQCGLLVGLLTLYLMRRGRWSWVKDVAAQWNLFIPPLVALGMYSLIFATPRYFGAFVVLLWIGLFSGVRLPNTPESRRLVGRVTLALVMLFAIVVIPPAVKDASDIARSVANGEDASAHSSWQVAEGLRLMGVKPGDEVAVIESSSGSPIKPMYWARLAKVRIVAEVAPGALFLTQKAEQFWAADSIGKVIEAFGQTGAKVIVSEKARCSIPMHGWQRIGNTDYYAYVLAR